MAAKLRSSDLCRPRALKLMWHSSKKNNHNKILPFIGRSVPAGGPQPTSPLSAPLPCGTPAIVSWSGPVSLRKCLAGGLDGTAPPVVTSTPIHLTGAVEYIFSEDRRILYLPSRDKAASRFYNDYLCLPQILKNIGSARCPAVDIATNLSSLRL